MLAGTDLLRPARTVNAPAAPPVTSVDIAETDIESSNGPKITSELVAIHATAIAMSQPVAHPHHSRSASLVQRLEIPAKAMIARKNSAMKRGTPKQV